MAAGITFGTAGRVGCAHRFGPRQFRRTRFDQKIARVVRAKVLLRHPLNDPIAHINRIKSHATFFLLSQTDAAIQSTELFSLYARQP